MSEVVGRAAARLRLALDLFATGESLARQRLRRLHPEWTAGQVEEQLRRWLEQRPGPSAGDAEGRATPRPEDVS
jgi:hypothetical protein